MTSENQKSWLRRHCRRRAIYWLLRSPSQTCHAKPKTCKITQGAGRYQLLSRGGFYRKQLGLKDFSPKSRDAVALQQYLLSVALYRDWSWISVRQSTVAATFRASLPGAGYGRLSIRLTAWLQNSKKRAGTVREIDVWAESPRLFSALARLHHLPAAAVNHYRDNAITYKAQREQKCQRIEAGERGTTTCRCVSVMLLRSMQNTRRSYWC